MDIFESRYYRINKYLLTYLGQWPYQDPLQKFLIRTLLNCLTVSIIVPEILQMIDVWGELSSVIDCVSVIAVQFTNNVKLANYIFNVDKLKGLLTRIRDDWAADFVGPQLNILKDYANEGRKLTLIYADFYTMENFIAFISNLCEMNTKRQNYLKRVETTYIPCISIRMFCSKTLKICMYSTLVFYTIMPLMTKILDVVMPLNESRPAVSQLPTKYGNVNPDKYYFPIMIHADMSTTFSITTIVAIDTTYALYVQHACGIFATLGHRLENLIGSNDYEELDQLSAEQQAEVTYRDVVSCVKMHKDAIEFADAIESSHFVVFFIVFAMSVFCMSLAGFQMVMNLDKPNEAIRFASFTFAQVAHIFFISWPGQKLIDHSQRIHESVYRTRWYLVDDRSKKLLMIMMLRGIEPCKLTAGKFYIMDLTNFSLVVRTSVSYFTMLTSFK